MILSKTIEGSSLIVIIVAIALMTTISASIQIILNRQLETIQIEEALVGIKRVKNNINNIAKLPKATLLKWIKDSNFKNCLTEGSTCFSGEFQNITLEYDLSDFKIAPTIRDKYGQICQGTSCSPYYKVTINYSVICPNNLSECSVASQIELKLNIHFTDENKNDIDENFPLFRFNCPPGMAVIGVNKDGSLECKEFPVVQKGEKGVDGIDNFIPGLYSQNNPELEKAMQKFCGATTQGADDKWVDGKRTWSHSQCPISGRYNGQDWDSSILLGYDHAQLHTVKKIHGACLKYKYGGGAYVWAFDFSKPGCPAVEPLSEWRNCIGCFIKGTKITLANGTEKPIEKIKIGDKLYNPITNQETEVAVVKKGPEENPLFKIKTEEYTIVVTYNHPMLTQNGYIMAKDVKKWDYLYNQSGQEIVVINNTMVHSELAPIVYNIEVFGKNENDHFILSNGLITGDLRLQNRLAEIE